MSQWAREPVPALPPEQREIAQILRHNSIELQRQIEELLNYGAIQFHRLKLELAPVNPRQVLERVTQNQKLALQAKNLTLRTRSTDAVVIADAEKIGVVLDNLLSNAIKFSPADGTITVNMHSNAGQDLQRMLDLEADQPTGQFEMAMLLLSRQQPPEALVHLKKATAWDKLSPPFLCTQAQVQDQLGQFPEALKTLDQAETGVPDDPHIPYVRAMILARNGRNDEARVAANRALKLQPDFQPAVELRQRLAGKE